MNHNEPNVSHQRTQEDLRESERKGVLKETGREFEDTFNEGIVSNYPLIGFLK